MKKSNLFAFLGSAGLSLAILSIAAGTCPTAKLGQANCATTMNASCNMSVEFPGDAAPSRCVEVTAANNRKPGICGDPNDKQKKCLTSPGNVAITYISYAVIYDPTGECIDCNLTLVLRTASTVVNCATTQQDSQDSPECSGG